MSTTPTKMPNLAELCLPIPEMPSQPLCLTLPGGIELCPTVGYQQIGLLEFVQQAMQSAQAALAPMQPIFELIEIVTLIHEALTAIPDVIGPPPNPEPLLKVLTKLAAKFEKLILMTPPFAGPLMVVQLIDIFIAHVRGLAHELSAVARQIEAMENAKTLALTNPGLKPILDCVQMSVNVHLSNLERIFLPVNSMIRLLNLIAGLAQMGDPFPIPEVTPFGPEVSIQAHALMLTELADKMQVIRGQIPI